MGLVLALLNKGAPEGYLEIPSRNTLANVLFAMTNVASGIEDLGAGWDLTGRGKVLYTFFVRHFLLVR